MKAKVTEQGIVIPKEMLEDVEEVEIQKENNTIKVTPTKKNAILELGKHPVKCDINDASSNTDKYIYTNQ